MPDDHIFTQAVHAGEGQPPPEGRPSATPIYPAVTYTYPDMQDLSAVLGGERSGYVYARYGSATISAVEKAVATLEGAEEAVAFASGMAALHLALIQAGVKSDTPIVAANDLYGATHTLLAQFYPNLDPSPLRYVDMADLGAARAAIAEVRPRAVLLEIMSNPLLKIAELPAIAAAAQQAGATVIVDSTFTTPFLIQPLKHGADIVVHSATKYLGGHGDVLAGMIAATTNRARELRQLLKIYGGNLGPFEAWTVLRGIKTLPLRMRAHCANASIVAEWLSGHARVAQVWYPGRPDHPQHQLARRLFREDCFGGMVAFELRDSGQAEVFRFMEALQLIQTGPSLGNVESLILYPAIASHRGLTREERYRLGITDGVVRLSVGIEDAADIIADLDRALAAC
ncbi:MAG TPA: PLP-dependent aspartate aminotransferase family protein [Anaerolineae bacterium]|nr:PLP-dependent aspartate aminotransferase family protein [Anaerolineae bacterium]